MTIKLDAELLKQALIATDEYLGMYKNAAGKGKTSSAELKEFTAKIGIAMEALKKFGELDNHNPYIESIIAKMAKLVNDYEEHSFFHNNQEEKEHSFKAYMAEKTDKEKEELSDEELDDLAKSIKWEDFCDLYDENDFEKGSLTEKISAISRMKKHMHFARTSAKRGVALSMKLHRPASRDVMMKRAKVAARRLLAKRLLQGRDKSQLTAQQKDSLEARIKAMGKVQQVLVQKLMPHMRDIERKRLKK